MLPEEEWRKEDTKMTDMLNIYFSYVLFIFRLE
jgi:hypothetical protein